MAERVITISGVSWESAISGSQVSQEENWPKPTVLRRGRGWQYRLPWSMDLAEKVASHLETLGSTFVTLDDPDDRAEGRALLRDAARIRTQMEEGQ